MERGPIAERLPSLLRVAAWAAFLVVLFAPLAAADTMNLVGVWKFTADWDEGGLKAGWQKPEFDDSKWRNLNVPGAWEDQGVTKPNPRWPSTAENDGYNGYAWYRKHVQIPADWKGGSTVLHFGGIDDLDWTYVNGTLVGSTTQSGKDKDEREYTIPAGVLKPGADNVIAVRVCDTGGWGGILKEPVELEHEAAGGEGDEGGAGPMHGGSMPGGYLHKHDGDLNKMGGSVTVPADMEVDGNVSAVGGSVDIAGHVTGNVSAVGGSVVLRPTARVDGQAVAMGGRVDKQEGAVVEGGVTDFNGVPAGFLRRAWEGGDRHDDWFGEHMASDFFSVLLRWGFLALLAALLLPRRLEVMARALPLLPGRAALYGTVGLVLTPAALVAAALLSAVIAIVLCITIVGILALPAVPAALAGVCIAVIVCGVLGSIGVMLSLGQAILARFRPESQSTVAAAVVGALAIVILGQIPVIGPLVALTVLIFGYGLGLMTGLGSSDNWSDWFVPQHPSPAPAGAPGTVTPPPPPAETTRVVARSRGTEGAPPPEPPAGGGGEGPPTT